MSDPTQLRKQGVVRPATASLIGRMHQMCNDYPQDVVATSTMNIFVNCISQQFDLSHLAEDEFNRIVHQARELLKSHYNPMTRKKLTVSPAIMMTDPADAFKN